MVRRNSWEPRAGNAKFNETKGTPLQTDPNQWLPADTGAATRALFARVNGNFTGTTDEIIQWAAFKWGFDEDHVRAQAHLESQWYQDALGDGGESIGMLQVRCMWGNIHQGACPNSQRSTAFNLDYALGHMRAAYEGYFYYWPVNTKGNIERVWALWYGGMNYLGPAATEYVQRVKLRIEQRPWTTSAFASG